VSVLEGIFQPETADARRSREAKKVPTRPAGAPPIRTDDGSEVVIPVLADLDSASKDD
jgi:hypothetical protein